MRVWILVFLMTLSVGAKRAERPAFKGQQLYSWQVSGTWTYVILPGTNRYKNWGDLQKAPHWREDQLRQALSDLAVVSLQLPQDLPD